MEHQAVGTATIAAVERTSGPEQGARLLPASCCQAERIAHCFGALAASYNHRHGPAPAVQPCPAPPVGLEPGTPPPPEVPGPAPASVVGGTGEGGGKAQLLPLCLEHLLRLPCNPQGPLPVPQDFLKVSEPLPNSLCSCSPGSAQS